MKNYLKILFVVMFFNFVFPLFIRPATAIEPEELEKVAEEIKLLEETDPELAQELRDQFKDAVGKGEIEIDFGDSPLKDDGAYDRVDHDKPTFEEQIEFIKKVKDVAGPEISKGDFEKLKDAMDKDNPEEIREFLDKLSEETRQKIFEHEGKFGHEDKGEYEHFGDFENFSDDLFSTPPAGEEGKDWSLDFKDNSPSDPFTDVDSHSEQIPEATREYFREILGEEAEHRYQEAGREAQDHFIKEIEIEGKDHDEVEKMFREMETQHREGMEHDKSEREHVEMEVREHDAAREFESSVHEREVIREIEQREVERPEREMEREVVHEIEREFEAPEREILEHSHEMEHQPPQ